MNFDIRIYDIKLKKKIENQSPIIEGSLCNIYGK